MLKDLAVRDHIKENIVIPPGTTASVDKYLNIIIRLTE